MSEKKHDDDDDMTVVNMNVDGMRGYKTEQEQKWSKDLNRLKLSRKERFAIMLGAFKATIPAILCILVGFGLVITLMYVWLKP